jgi:hypothetical protein
MKVIFTLSIGFSGAKRQEEFEVEDDITDDQLDQDWQDWSANYIDGGWRKVEE